MIITDVGIAILLAGLIALLIYYNRAAKEEGKRVKIVNPWTVSLLVIVSVLLIFDLFK